MKSAEISNPGVAHALAVRPVPVDRAWIWLGAAWSDLRRAPLVTLLYGAAIVIVSYGLLFLVSQVELFYLVLPLTGAFFLLGPLLALGLYETSRRLAAGQPASVRAAFTSWLGSGQVAIFGFLLIILHLAWVEAALLLFALHFGLHPPSPERLLEAAFVDPGSLLFLVTGVVVGAPFAVMTFAISAVSVPLMLERDCDVATAVLTSLHAVIVNWRAMTLWAVLIVGFTGFGFATAFFGLALVLPLIGYATWHAYKDLVI